VADLMRCHYLQNTDCCAHQGAVRLVALTCTHFAWHVACAHMQQACGLTTRSCVCSNGTAVQTCAASIAFMKRIERSHILPLPVLGYDCKAVHSLRLCISFSLHASPLLSAPLLTILWHSSTHQPTATSGAQSRACQPDADQPHCLSCLWPRRMYRVSARKQLSQNFILDEQVSGCVILISQQLMYSCMLHRYRFEQALVKSASRQAATVD
jgi:hypothetical protein